MAQVDFVFGSELCKHRSALRVARSLGVQFEKIYDTEVKCNSPSFYAFDNCNDRTEYFRRISDIGRSIVAFTQRSLNLVFSENKF